jgi:hypothetical protein
MYTSWNIILLDNALTYLLNYLQIPSYLLQTEFSTLSDFDSYVEIGRK